MCYVKLDFEDLINNIDREKDDSSHISIKLQHTNLRIGHLRRVSKESRLIYPQSLPFSENREKEDISFTFLLSRHLEPKQICFQVSLSSFP